MPNHIDTIQLTQAQLERGAREEKYRRQVKDWSDGKTSDAQWIEQRKDPQFNQFCWRVGVV